MRTSDKAGRAADIAGNALRADHSKGHLASSIPNSVATPNGVGNPGNVDTEDRRTDRSMGDRPELER